MSVTSETYKWPLLEMMSDFCEDDREAINDDGNEHAAFIYHRPGRWKREQVYVVVRSMYEIAGLKILERAWVTGEYTAFSSSILFHGNVMLPELGLCHRRDIFFQII